MRIKALHSEGKLTVEAFRGTGLLETDHLKMVMLPNEIQTIDDDWACCIGNHAHLEILSFDDNDLRFVTQREFNTRLDSISNAAPYASNIKVGVMTISAIAAGERLVATSNVGKLGNNTQALVSFFPSSVSNTDIKNFQYQDSLPIIKGGILNKAKTLINVKGVVIDESRFGLLPSYFLLAFSNYNFARRFTLKNNEGQGKEKYNSGDYDAEGWTYSDIGLGVLAGWYDFYSGATINAPLNIVDGGDNGLMIEIESIWLTSSGNNTIVNLALRNRDSVSSVSKDIKVGVYE